MDGFVRGSGTNTDDVALAMGLGLDRELAEMSRGMKRLAEVSSSTIDGLGALRNGVEMMMSSVREREKFEGEVLATMNVLSEGMQSIAAQRSVFEAHVLGSLETLSQKLEALGASQARGGRQFPLVATVRVTCEADEEQDRSR